MGRGLWQAERVWGPEASSGLGSARVGVKLCVSVVPGCCRGPLPTAPNARRVPLQSARAAVSSRDIQGCAARLRRRWGSDAGGTRMRVGLRELSSQGRALGAWPAGRGRSASPGSAPSRGGASGLGGAVGIPAEPSRGGGGRAGEGFEAAPQPATVGVAAEGGVASARLPPGCARSPLPADRPPPGAAHRETPETCWRGRRERELRPASRLRRR